MRSPPLRQETHNVRAQRLPRAGHLLQASGHHGRQTAELVVLDDDVAGGDRDAHPHRSVELISRVQLSDRSVHRGRCVERRGRRAERHEQAIAARLDHLATVSLGRCPERLHLLCGDPMASLLAEARHRGRRLHGVDDQDGDARVHCETSSRGHRRR